MSAPDVSLWRGWALLKVGLVLQGETFDWKRAGGRTGLTDEETHAAIRWLRDLKYVQDAGADAVTITPAGLVYFWRAPDAETWRGRKLIQWGLAQGDTFDWKRAGVEESHLTEQEICAAYEWLRDRGYVEDAGTDMVSVTSQGKEFSRPVYFLGETPLPMSREAVVGDWLYDCPLNTIVDRHVIRPIDRFTFSANGEAIRHGVTTFTVDGVLRSVGKPKQYAGTWKIENDKLVVDLRSGPVPHSVYTLIQILLSGGETRVCLKGVRGGLYWRVEAE